MLNSIVIGRERGGEEEKKGNGLMVPSGEERDGRREKGFWGGVRGVTVHVAGSRLEPSG